MPHFSFSTDPDPDGDPPSFDVDGEKFVCIPTLPSGVHRLLGQHSWALWACHAFIEGCLADEEQVDRWRLLSMRKERPLTNEGVGKILDALIGAYADRPTESPSDSVGGRATTEPGSTDAAASPAST